MLVNKIFSINEKLLNFLKNTKFLLCIQYHYINGFCQTLTPSPRQLFLFNDLTFTFVDEETANRLPSNSIPLGQSAFVYSLANIDVPADQSAESSNSVTDDCNVYDQVAVELENYENLEDMQK